MAATHLLLYFILCLFAPEVCLQQLYRIHVFEEAHTVIAVCPPHDASYTYRVWEWGETLLRPDQVVYQQNRGGAIDADRGARADISVNPSDFNLTIGSLHVRDTGLLFCLVNPGTQESAADTLLVVYNHFIDVQHGASLTLQCPIADADFTLREWYTWGDSSTPIYSQTTSGVTKGSEARDDMSLDAGSFKLTIGRVSSQDYIFTCSVTKQQTINVGIIFTAIYRVMFDAEERTSVTLPCDEVRKQSSQRSGDPYYTRTWQSVNGDALYHQYLYNGVFYERRPAARADISLNNETFALTIASVQLQDDTMFVCTYDYSYPESVKLNIYINPIIILSGLDDTPVSVGSTVTVTCTIDRVYPELEPDAFVMRWGTQIIVSTGSQNNDKSYRYSIQYTHTIINDDHGMLLECLVNPRIGQSDSLSRPVVVNAQNLIPSTSPLFTDGMSPSDADGVSPSATSEGSPPVPGGLSLPVVGGAAAAAAVLIIIIVVIIGVCVCIRRKDRVNRKSGQSGKSVDAVNGCDMTLPELTSHDEKYLPSEDVYEEIVEEDDAIPPTGVFTVHNLHHADTGSYLHPPENNGYKEPTEDDAIPPTGVFTVHNLHHADTGSYLHPPEHEGYKEPTEDEAGYIDERYLDIISADQFKHPQSHEYEKLEQEGQYQKLQL